MLSYLFRIKNLKGINGHDDKNLRIFRIIVTKNIYFLITCPHSLLKFMHDSTHAHEKRKASVIRERTLLVCSILQYSFNIHMCDFFA